MNEESIFAAALEKTDPSERAAYLEQACNGDLDLRRQVESLLHAHHGAGSFLEEPVLHQAGTADEPDADATLAEPGGDDLVLSFLLPPGRPGALGRLKHYEVLEVIGRGGMGVVFKATDEVLQRVVAVKVMAPQLAASAAARKRFIREAQAAAAVRDEHVVDIHAVDEVNGLPYLVMELVTGMSLQERLDREGPLELKEVLRIGVQTAAGLAAAHRQGLVHRDIKPANILLENGVQRVKLTDFGLARAVDDASLTQSGVIAGTPMYMAPEQARGEAIDHRADLFSLGSVLYAMCTGHPPFRAGTALAVLRRVSEDSPRPLRAINPDVPAWLAALIARLHAKDPAGRFASAKEVGELLEQHLARLQQPSQPTSPQPVPAPRARPRRPGRWAAAAALLLALVGLGAAETLGVTHVRDYVATVLRIGTPDGTLVVEVNDPGVKVTIDGDGDEIAITGAGLQEVRLRPGRYRLRASKNGVPLPLDNDLVTITRGGRQLVKVSREPAGTQPSSDDAKARPSPRGAPLLFLVLGRGGKPRQSFATLAAAVAAADSGDIIEVGGNGPFISQPIRLGDKPLRLRAGRGCRPVIRLAAEGNPAGEPLLDVDAPLTLEGLELQRSAPRFSGGTLPTLIRCGRSPVALAGCRLLIEGDAVALFAQETSCLTVHACEIVSLNWFAPLDWVCPPGGRMTVENTLITGGIGGLAFHYRQPDLRDIAIRLRHNTLAADKPLKLYLDRRLQERDARPIRLEASGNVFHARTWVFGFDQSGPFLDENKALEPAAAVEVLRRLLDWREDRNVYQANVSPLGLTVREQPRDAPRGKTLGDWKDLWKGGSSACLQGPILYKDSGVRLSGDAQVRAADFRLCGSSTGRYGGKDGRDLGADVDLVGPGASYERWQKTAGYRQWLRDSGLKEGR